MENKFETMTVKELKEESKKRGLTLESKGHKFNKGELIERIMKYEEEQKDIQHDIQKKIDEAGECEKLVTSENDKDSESWIEDSKEAEATEEESVEETKYISYANTLEEIEKKYGNRKKQEIYDNELKAGSFVVFIHYVEALNGNIYKKLRTAKVTGVNRRKELVRVTTLLGTEKELTFDELLYIKGVGEHCSYPKDIATYLRNQRTEKGKVLINERFTENNVTSEGQC